MIDVPGEPDPAREPLHNLIAPTAGVRGCRVYWGSHGCYRPQGHPDDIPHECNCCDCGEHHPYPVWPDEQVLCVAKPPYYGPDTHFYGEDAERLGLPLVSELHG